MMRTQPLNYFQKEENPMKVTEMEHQVLCYNGQYLYYRSFAQKMFMFPVLKN